MSSNEKVINPAWEAERMDQGFSPYFGSQWRPVDRIKEQNFLAMQCSPDGYLYRGGVFQGGESVPYELLNGTIESRGGLFVCAKDVKTDEIVAAVHEFAAQTGQWHLVLKYSNDAYAQEVNDRGVIERLGNVFAVNTMFHFLVECG